MKNTILKTILFIVLGAGALMNYSCKEGSLAEYDPEFAGIYFQNDSLRYSFGVTPFEIDRHNLEIPVKIMGAPVSYDRSFTVTIDPSKSTAEPNVHYQIEKEFVIPADSVNGVIDLVILREPLGDDEFKLSFSLDDAGDFKPVNEKFKNLVVYFNNRVDPPDWKDFWGEFSWPDYKLGAWDPLTYIKFIELFREMKHIVPDTYQSMVNEFGEDMKNVEFGWAWDYDKSLTKYVLIPLYQYFMEENPELGIVIPRPDGY